MAYLDFNNFIQGAKAAADMNRNDADSAQRRQSQQLIDARAEGDYALRMSMDVPKARAEMEAFAGSTAALAQLGQIQTALHQQTNPDGSRLNEMQAAEFIRNKFQNQFKTSDQSSDLAQTAYLARLPDMSKRLSGLYAAGSGVAQATAQDLGVGRDYVQVARNLQELNNPDKVAQNMTGFGFTPTGKPEEGLWMDASGRVVSAYDYLRSKAALAVNDMSNTMPIAEADRANQLTRQINMLNASNVVAFDQTPGTMKIPTYTGQGVLTVNRAVAEAVAAAQAAGASPAQVADAAQKAADAVTKTTTPPPATTPAPATAVFAPWSSTQQFDARSMFPRTANDPFSGSADSTLYTTPTAYAPRHAELQQKIQEVETGSGGLAQNPELWARAKAQLPEMLKQLDQLRSQHAAAAEFTYAAEQALKQQELIKRLGLPGLTSPGTPLVAPYGLALDQRWLERLRTAGVIAPQGTPDTRPGAGAGPMW